jgi:hypothetical protein
MCANIFEPTAHGGRRIGQPAPVLASRPSAVFVTAPAHKHLRVTLPGNQRSQHGPGDSPKTSLTTVQPNSGVLHYVLQPLGFPATTTCCVAESAHGVGCGTCLDPRLVMTVLR